VLRSNTCDRIVYVDYVLRSGVALFEKACELDLEGIVAKYRHGRYVSGRDDSTWFKIVEHIEERGTQVFQWAVTHDLEGIVAKHRQGRYASGREDSTWFKIRNRNYSQWAGRDELFEARDVKQRAGWDVCSKAASAVAGL